MNIKILFEDRDLLVLDKPAGMIVNRSDTTGEVKTLQGWVEGYLKIRNPKSEIPARRCFASSDAGGRNRYQIPNSNIQNGFEFRDSSFEFAARAGIVHRLDKETSGIILVAKTPESFINLQVQFKERRVKKTYIALVHGKVEPAEGEINVPVGRLPWNRKRFGVLSGGRESLTQYKTIKNFQSTMNDEPLTLLELYPQTGRTHQIRIHLQYIHHPIFADPLYAGRKTGRNDRQLLSRIFLHASKISFFHPKTRRIVVFESPLPDDLRGFLPRLNS